MKKYWQLIVIVGVIVVAVSIHYIQIANAKQKDYHFTFDKISGDDKYVDSLLIEGDLEEGMEYSSIIIGTDKTTVVDESNYQYASLLFRELIDKNKNFMRGKKSFSANNYFEDDIKLVYAEEPDEMWNKKDNDFYSFKIDVIDKVKNERFTFKIPTQFKDGINWISITNTSVVNNELKLFVRHTLNNRNENLYLMTIDLSKQQLVSENLIETISNEESVNSYLEVYNQYHHLGFEKYFVYSTTKYNNEKEVNSFISRKFKVVNVETNEVTQLDLPEGLETDMQRGAVDNNIFVAARMTDTDTWIYRYNIGQQRWLEPVKAPHPMKFVNKGLDNTYGYNGKLYVLNEMKKDFVLQIFDIEEGTTLYEGVLSKENAEQRYYLWANRILERTE